MKQRVCLLLTALTFCAAVSAQNVNIDAKDKNTLSFNVSVQSFYKNNEYKRKIAYGYTLGGMRIIPHLQYQPLNNLTVSIGGNFLRYWGADRYGQYSFVSVPYYSDTHTQNQLHRHPYMQINWQINPKLNLIMGNLVNSHCHYLPVPLYNKELVYSADAEEGIQLLYQSNYWFNDVWLNWQNFNFVNDIDREAFVLGLSGGVHSLIEQKKYSYAFNYSLMWQHHGGELDTISFLPLDHWINGRLGGSFSLHNIGRQSSDIVLSFDYLFCKALKNDTWYFSSGHALFPTIAYENKKYGITVGYYDSKDMATLFGTNFFANIAQREANVTYPHNRMLYGAFNYNINLDKSTDLSRSNYTLSLTGEIFYKTDKETSVDKEDNSLSFGLGVVLTLNPSFKIHKFKDIKSL
ncbi:MAG: hypothetical protein J6M30_04540 [Bacteroidales bacterium]|nr:hypothetical protein [Bacteroidales bacterium]